VICDGRKVFSKREVGRFPVEDEVENRIAVLREGHEPPSEAGPESKSVLRRLADKFRN